jgi:hypothetical protein
VNDDNFTTAVKIIFFYRWAVKWFGFDWDCSASWQSGLISRKVRS